MTDQATGEQIVGRFGWKCQQGSLFTFSGDAYLNEMGITTPLFPDENCPQGNCALLAGKPGASNPNEPDNDDLAAFTNFMSLLAPPPTVAAGVVGEERSQDIRDDRMCQLPLPRASDRSQYDRGT